jgi:hypothetical protein
MERQLLNHGLLGIVLQRMHVGTVTHASLEFGVRDYTHWWLVWQGREPFRW